MEKLSFSQLQYIQREYYILHNDTANYYVNNEFNKLQIARGKLSVFVNLIENIFECDFYKEVLPQIHIEGKGALNSKPICH